MWVRALLLLLLFLRQGLCNWNEWWTYDGISGPTYWGVINPAWHVCSRGKHQSPMDLDPDKLVRDDTLLPLKVDKQAVEGGVLYNTGQSLVLRAERGLSRGGAAVNITGGPLAYRYEFAQMYVHWGQDNTKGGSEHSVGKQFFAGEVQLLGFNANLYKNLSQAMGNPHGVVGVAVMIREEERGINKALSAIAQQAKKVLYRGQNQPVPSFSLADLLPSTETFMTYEGSATQPGCSEGLTWILMNRPVYLGSADFASLRAVMQGEKVQPKSPLGPNVRPLQDSNGRSVRTNIAFNNEGNDDTIYKKKGKKKECPDVAKNTYYKANSWGEV